MKIKVLPVGELGTNCYILEDEADKLAAVIDPGDEAGRVAEAVERSGCQLRYVLLTHGHYDHFTGLAGLLEKYDVPVYIHPADAEEGRNNPWSLKFPRLDEAHQRWYGEGDTLTLGSLIIHVLSTPGHSKGSVVLRCEDVLFTGDTLFAGSCGRVDLAGGDWDEMLASLRRLYGLEGEYRVLPGHMNASILSREREYNMYMKQALK